jgi:hypothetical protein
MKHYIKLKLYLFSLAFSLVLLPLPLIVLSTIFEINGLLQYKLIILFFLFTLIYVYYRKFYYYIIGSNISFVFILVFSVFLFRLNFGVYDIVYPTDLLGSVFRSSNGIDPMRFTNFPEFLANYHQHFIILAGFIKAVFDIKTSTAIYFNYIFGFIFFYLVTIKFIEYNFKPLVTNLFFLLILFSCGLPVKLIQEDEPRYIIILDILMSNSWIYGFSILLILLLLFKHLFEYNNSKKTLFLIATCFFLIAVTNASIFTFLVVSLFIFYLSQYKYYSFNYLFYIFTLFIVIIFLVRFIPSAFLVGENYFYPIFHFRLFENFNNSLLLKYFLLSGPLPLIASFLLIKEYITSTYFNNKFNIFITIFFFSTYIFPFIFSVNNIDTWDAIHKNSTLAIFTSAVVIINIFSYNRSKYLLIFCGLSLVFNYLFLYSIFIPKFTINPTWVYQYNFLEYKSFPLRQYAPFVSFPINYTGLGSHSLYNSLSGGYTKNSMYPGFLVVLKDGEYPLINKFHDINWINNYVDINNIKIPSYIQISIHSYDDFYSWYNKNINSLSFIIDFNSQNNFIFEDFLYLKLKK